MDAICCFFDSGSSELVVVGSLSGWCKDGACATLGNGQRHDPRTHHTERGWLPFRCASRVIEVGVTCRSGSFSMPRHPRSFNTQLTPFFTQFGHCTITHHPSPSCRVDDLSGQQPSPLYMHHNLISAVQCQIFHHYSPLVSRITHPSAPCPVESILPSEPRY
jgi:hypothetical protein